MDITTCNIEEPQQKNHLGTVDDRFLCPEGGGEGGGWPSQESTFVAFSFVLCSVLFDFLNVSILTLHVSNLFNSVKVTELPPVWERAANSPYHL